MIDRIITKILAHIDDMPTEILQRVQGALTFELSNYDISPKTKDMIAEYVLWYKEQYGCLPGDKCMRSFCELNRIPQPLPEPDDKCEFDFLQ